MNILRLVASSVGSARSSHNFGRDRALGSEAGIFDMIKAAAKKKFEGYKAQALEEKGTGQVLQMSESMLMDIGLSSADRDSLQAGLTSLEKLNAERETHNGQFDRKDR